MTLRTPNLVRALSLSSTQRVNRQAVAPGLPVDISSYTSTGGSGDDSTTLSASLDEASNKTKAAYRKAIRDIPDMRRNFTIMEDKSYLTAVIRDNFERHRNVTDPKIVDMLVFKALQELREIREQWKSRHHVYGYIHRYSDKLLREELAHRASSPDVSHKREQMLADWRDRGLVPSEIVTWAMFIHWKSDEDMKFRKFALDNNLFSNQQLDRNANLSPSCAVM